MAMSAPRLPSERSPRFVRLTFESYHANISSYDTTRGTKESRGRREPLERIILHSDMNSFYASVEQAQRPELRGRPVVVAGKEELRHGIVLTKSAEAQAYGIRPAATLWPARKKGQDPLVLPPRYKLYRAYSEMARAIYNQYTDLVEPFGLDESWLDITGSMRRRGWDA